MFSLRRKSRAMIDTVGGLRALLKWESLRADNLVFRLHYKVTFACILCCFFVVSAKLYSGDPIHCITSPAVEKLIDQYCWIHSTFTVMKKDKYGRLTYFAGDDQADKVDKHGGGEDDAKVAYPGVVAQGKRDKLVYHRYYQWVWFALFLQAVAFYIPKYIWKIMEGGRLRALVSGIQDQCQDECTLEIQKEQTIDYFMNYRSNWGAYAYKFYFCELLNLFNVGSQLVLMDAFFGHSLSSFGFELFAVTNEDPYKRTDPLAILFPKVTKCSFKAHGIGGSIIMHDAICVLSINNINEKMYLFLCAWFLVLFGISSIGFFCRLLTLTSWRIRFMTLSLSVNQGSTSITSSLRAIVRKIESSDWFVLSEIHKHTSPSIFASIVKELGERIGTHKETNNGRRRAGTHL